MYSVDLYNIFNICINQKKGSRGRDCMEVNLQLPVQSVLITTKVVN